MCKDVFEGIKAIPPKVVEDAYEDGIKGPLVQLGLFGEQIIKTLRFLTYPIQAAALRQDLIDRRIAQALSDIPEEQRIKPQDSVILEVADRLKYQLNDNLVSDMYVDLLSASMDSERVKLAHPSFIHLISQISSDEAFLLLKMSGFETCAYMRRMSDWDVVSKEERENIYSSATYTIRGIEQNLIEILLKPEDLHFPDNFYIYIEHLRALEIIEYTNEFDVPMRWKQRSDSSYAFWFIRVSKFGRLFFDCCSKSLNKMS
ncbi:Abi-alpha family protein [Pantoea ananatis]|uniref:Abi-alpha family protein n=1 Tax=Pantoea ananas TaxID=553 RepID=UPI003FA4346F